MNSNSEPLLANTWLRLVLAGVLWAARAIAPTEQMPPTLMVLGLDVMLVTVHLWVNEPMRKQNRKSFGRAGSFGSLLLVPLILAVFFVVRDVWFAVTGTPL